MAAVCEIEDCGVQAIGRCERCAAAFCGTHQVRPESSGLQAAAPLDRCTACQARDYVQARNEAVGEYIDWRSRVDDPVEALLVGVRLLLSLAQADALLWRRDNSWARVPGLGDCTRLTAAVFPGLAVGQSVPTIMPTADGDGLRIGCDDLRELPWAPDGGALWEPGVIGAWFVDRARRAHLGPNGSFRSLVVHRRLLRPDETSFADPRPAWVFPGGSTAEGSSSNPHAGSFAYAAAILMDGSTHLHCHLSGDCEAFDSGKSFPDSNLAVRAAVRMADILGLREFPLSAKALS
jgi:hypothetical protein